MTTKKQNSSNVQSFSDIFKDKSVVSVILATLILLLISFFAFKYFGSSSNVNTGDLNGNGASTSNKEEKKDDTKVDGTNKQENSTDKNIKAGDNTSNAWVANDYKINEKKDANKNHTVVRGDTLWEIAEAYYGNGADWVKIAQANNVSYLANGNPLIVPGQVLTIP